MTIDSFILDVTIGESEQRIIAASLDVSSGMDLRSSLTIDERSAVSEFTIAEFGTEPLRIGITTVLSGSDTLMGSEELDIECKCQFHLLPSFMETLTRQSSL